MMYQGNQNRRNETAGLRPGYTQVKHTALNEENYVALAEKAIDMVIAAGTDQRGRVNVVSTSKLRNLLSMTSDIYNEVVNQREDSLSSEMKGRINYLKIRFIYESGRDKAVKDLFECGDIKAHIDDIGDSRKQYILFSRYMESLVAFRKFKVDRDE